MQTAKWGSPFMSVNDPFDFVVFRADPVGFVPVDFRMRYRTIRKFNCRNSLELPPAPFAVQPPKPLLLSDGGADRNDFHIGNTANDPEFHASRRHQGSRLRTPACAAATAAAIARTIARHDAAAE